MVVGQGCNDTSPAEGNPCVMRRSLGGGAAGASAGACDGVTPAVDVVVALEMRDGFNGYTDMEMLAAPAEIATAAAALRAAGTPFGVFPEDHGHAVRVFEGGIPVRWADAAVVTGGGAPAFAGAAPPGMVFVFQLGLWAYAGALRNVSAVASDLAGPCLVRGSDVSVFNLGACACGRPVEALLRLVPLLRRRVLIARADPMSQLGLTRVACHG